jgi:hypothetical protein
LDRFAVSMRAYSAVHFDLDDHLRIGWPDAAAVVVSEYTGGKNGRAYPVTLAGEIQGEAESLQDAQLRLGGALANALPVFALAANAAVADPLPIGAYGLDLTDPQPLMWYCTPPADSWFPPGEKRIVPDLVLALMTAVGHHPQTELLHRAIESYRRALQYWVPEQKLLAGEFLFIAVETLSRCLVETRAAEKGMTPKNLARLNGLSSPNELRTQFMLEDIFNKDQEAVDAMSEASNGFEHGYMKVEDVRASMEPVLDRTMGHVRRALITLAGVDNSTSKELLSKDYEDPRGLVPAINIIHGNLHRKDPDHPPPVIDPFGVDLVWQSPKIRAERKPSGELELELPTKIAVVKMPENAELGVEGTGLRAGYIRSVKPPKVS